MMFVHQQQLRYAPIGAYELKRTYQKNMILANAAVLFLLAAAFTVAGLALQKEGLVAPAAPRELVILPDSLAVLLIPPSVVQPPKEIKVERKNEDLIGALPTVAPDDSVLVDFTMAAPEDIHATSPNLDTMGGRLEGLTGTQDASDDTAGVIFTLVDEYPCQVDLPSPHYPELARKAGIEGNVWLKVLIDKNGIVRQVELLKDSGTGAGFEEAAIAAAWEGKWTPALQNKQPVAVWVAYEVKFRLR